MKEILSLLIFISFPLREAIGIDIGIPIRIGELAIYLYAFYTITTFYTNNTLKKGVFNKKTFVLVSLLFLNLLFCIIVSTNSTIDKDFFIKYIFRNTCILIFIFSVMINPIKIEIDWSKFFKYIIIIQVIFCFIQICGKDVYFLKIINYNPQKYFGLTRLKGTASEPGYLPVIIAPALYYFRSFKSLTNKIYYYVGVILLFFTFSSFAYLVIIFEVIFYIKSYRVKKSITIKSFICLLLCFFFSISAFYIYNSKIKYTKINEAIEFNIGKITSFVRKDEVDYSSQSRLQQLQIVVTKFENVDIFRKIIGMGTGSYSNYANSVGDSMMLESANEAHNLYISTLYDRGILGEIILISIILIILSISKGEKIESQFLALRYSIVIQIIHWGLTGNFWVYYFWIEVAILISSICFMKYKGSKEEILF
ncbi:O-antigen ligase family protein [Clostridium perfringens]|uniref:O-antigen ligase family protein n=1 Tax=Clostridium perfringens TaxID=1502 RepID=UPI000D711A67|nr:O-antigen ligase family protein [Clostridium perfringens]PWX68717.1 hypothetical protein CYK74_14065 [Clostridium perfringens]